jgi:DUF4097 and DUF4098 domain-containing protein YvlB
MSWLLSVVIGSLIYTSTSSFSAFTSENLVMGNTPQLVVLTPQSVLQGDETERFEQTYPLNANGRISVDNVNGSIVIESWDRNEVKVEAVKIANSRERLKEVEIKVDAKPDSLKIETEFGTWKDGNRSWNCSGYCRLEVQYKLMVPRTAMLNEIETVNGSVTISNMTNYTKASAVNGSVKATNLRGTAHIETVNGTSDVTFDRLDNSSRINLSTVNGRVNLIIPSDADATIKADTVNGSISNEFNLPVRKGKYVGRDLYGKLGDGSVKINLDSVNGGLSIKRQQDGKNIKPVTNLLPAKESDEDDEDAVSSAASVSRMNRDIAKAVKESTKVSVSESVKIAEQVRKDVEKSMLNTRELQQVQREAMRAARETMRANRDMLNQTYAASWGDFDSSRIEEQSDAFPVKGTPKVTVDARNCSVSVRGWDKNEVKYRITKLIRGAAQPDVSVSVSNTESEVMINANVGKKKAANTPKPPKVKNKEDEIWVEAPLMPTFPGTAVRIEVFVPKKSNLRILTDREIRVEGISGNIDLSGNNEPINVRDSQGKLKIAADDALVRVIGFTGEVDSRTGDGANFFEGLFDKFSANVVSGKIILTLPEEANVDIQANTKINTEGFDQTEFNGDEKRRRIGEGGTTYTLRVDDGEVLVRNAKIINSGRD